MGHVFAGGNFMYGMVSKKATETGIIVDGSLPIRHRPVAFIWSPWFLLGTLSAEARPVENRSDVAQM